MRSGFNKRTIVLGRVSAAIALSALIFTKRPPSPQLLRYDVDGERIRIGSKALRLSVGIQAGAGTECTRDYSALLVL